MTRKLNDNDIYMIAELRKISVTWKWIGRIYQKNWQTIWGIYHYRMKHVKNIEA